MIEILPLTPCHIPSIAELEQILFSDPWKADALTSFFSQPHAKGAVCLENGILKGYALTTLVVGEGEILRIGIHPNAQKKGLGTHLITFVLKEGSLQGAEDFFLEVREGNLAARSLYQKVGFSQMGLRKNYYSDPTENAILYQIHLNMKETDL